MGTLRPFRLGRRPIRRRLLVLYRIDPDAARELLPRGCAPMVVNGHAIAGLCYTRLGAPNRRWLPGHLGSPSDHLAIRVAARFGTSESAKCGTWIVRRQTSSWIEARCGDKLLRTDYERAEFTLEDDPHRVILTVRTVRGEDLFLYAETTLDLRGSLFARPRDAENFLAATEDVRPSHIFAPEADDLALRAAAFAAKPLAVRELRCSFFESSGSFPPDAARLDCALRLIARPRADATERGEVIDTGGAAPALPTL